LYATAISFSGVLVLVSLGYMVGKHYICISGGFDPSFFYCLLIWVKQREHVDEQAVYNTLYIGEGLATCPPYLRVVEGRKEGLSLLIDAFFLPCTVHTE
jgi:hypothetical protein